MNSPRFKVVLGRIACDLIVSAIAVPFVTPSLFAAARMAHKMIKWEIDYLS